MEVEKKVDDGSGIGELLGAGSPVEENSATDGHEDPGTIVQHFTWDSEFDKDKESEENLAIGRDSGTKLLPNIFRWNGEAKDIYVCGSYDNWGSKMPLVKSQDCFYNVVEIPEGTHQYKFLVDDTWKCHPNEPMIDNGIGSQNNVLTINESDCEINDILVDSGGSSDGGSFSQYIPPRDASSCFSRHRPPSIPPHLLETILSREIPAHCEPTLVVEPSHVVLNHLYTLSIKDGVMVMSATHRYRKKYITTLLYRPILDRVTE